MPRFLTLDWGLLDMEVSEATVLVATARACKYCNKCLSSLWQPGPLLSTTVVSVGMADLVKLVMVLSGQEELALADLGLVEVSDMVALDLEVLGLEVSGLEV